MDFQAIKDSIPSSPALVLDAAAIINTLTRLASLRRQCGVNVLYAVKALPFSAVLTMAKPWVDGFSVSSLFEARLAHEILAGSGGIHLTTPGIRPDEWDEIAGPYSHGLKG